MAQKTYYDILGVSKNASDKEIKTAFRKLAQKHHPDAGGDEGRFKEISEAYDTLSNAQKRREYDQMLAFGGVGGAGASAGGAPWGDIFDSIFRGEGVGGSDWAQNFAGGFGGGGRVRQRRGGDLSLTVDVSAEDAFRGVTHKVTYRIPSTGEQQTITVAVPAGAVDGGKLRYRRRGEYGQNGGERGDLVVTTRVAEHPLFKRKGADVTMELPISVGEAVLGCQVEVPTPGGATVRLKIPAGTQSGRTFRFKDMGAPDVKRRGRSGALLVKVAVRIPDDLSGDEQKAYERIRELDTRDYRTHVDAYRATL